MKRLFKKKFSSPKAFYKSRSSTGISDMIYKLQNLFQKYAIGCHFKIGVSAQCVCVCVCVWYYYYLLTKQVLSDKMENTR